MRYVGAVVLGAITLVLGKQAVVGQYCPGDLNGDNRVNIDELITSVNSALLGCPPIGVRFVDNGDGTITDQMTRLTWEKKSRDDGIHHWENLYTWTDDGDGDPTDPDGTAFTEFIASLNDQSFAGQNDWRVPTLDELETLRDLGRFDPTTDPAFDDSCEQGCGVTQCSCTASSSYWSLSTAGNFEDRAWQLDFDIGGTNPVNKSLSAHVRAVRVGS